MIEVTRVASVPSGSGFGLYVHIPYCKAVCHYCDFAKTANFSKEQVSRFFGALTRQLDNWLEALKGVEAPRFTSVYFGGGTPSLFTHEYEGFLARLGDRVVEGAEMTLEANPDDVSAAALRSWRDLGFNRLSLGIQTFDERGLKALKRFHDREKAHESIAAACEHFGNVSIDLIFGWPGQDPATWTTDIEAATSFGIEHVSLYALTFETSTPLGRAQRRGKIRSISDEAYGLMYDSARQHLTTAGFVQEEVSNFARPGFPARHNSLYWQDAPYLGLGPGAHSYLPTAYVPDHLTNRFQAEEQARWFGLRWETRRSDRAFLALEAADSPSQCWQTLSELSVPDLPRAREQWLLEIVACGLRTADGLDLQRLERAGRCVFMPSTELQEALESGILGINTRSRLTLIPAEWFRETLWALKVAESFRDEKSMRPI